MNSYDKPTRLSVAAEELIIIAACELLGEPNEKNGTLPPWAGLVRQPFQADSHAHHQLAVSSMTPLRLENLTDANRPKCSRDTKGRARR